MLIIIMMFNVYLSENNEICYFHTNANDEHEIDFKKRIEQRVDICICDFNENFSQIVYLQKNEFVNNLIKIFIDDNKTDIVEMTLYFK